VKRRSPPQADGLSTCFEIASLAQRRRLRRVSLAMTMPVLCKAHQYYREKSSGALTFTYNSQNICQIVSNNFYQLFKEDMLGEV